MPEITTTMYSTSNAKEGNL